MAIKVFIVDDHYMVIEGIRSLLQNETDLEWMGMPPMPHPAWLYKTANTRCTINGY
jgi:DNA-binding NarL/FixJ family response regulator